MALGKKSWIVPDCELPPEGEGVMKGHESVIVVNDNDTDVKVKVTLFFEDAPCYDKIEWIVKAKSVKCFRMNKPEHMSGYVVPLETQYAMKIECDKPIVLQYGRLDNRQINLAYYTTLGYSE